MLGIVSPVLSYLGLIIPNDMVHSQYYILEYNKRVIHKGCDILSSLKLVEFYLNMLINF